MKKSIIEAIVTKKAAKSIENRKKKSKIWFSISVLVGRLSELKINKRAALLFGTIE